MNATVEVIRTGMGAYVDGPKGRAEIFHRPERAITCNFSLPEVWIVYPPGYLKPPFSGGLVMSFHDSYESALAAATEAVA